MSEADRAPAAPTGTKPLSAAQKALRKLGLSRDIDLALHLPLRYEDETRITPLKACRDGQLAQIEGVVTRSEVQLRPRRQLLVTVDDGTDTCQLRFFTFYPAHQKTLAQGQRVRVRGEVRGGFLGRTMVHPTFSGAGGELPEALTPVYPTSAQMPQAYLRKAVASGLRRADVSETLPAPLLDSLQSAVANGHGLRITLAQALRFLHQPTPDTALEALEDRSHPAWQRLKAEELLAQQLSQITAKRERERLVAPSLHADAGGLPEHLMARLPFALTAAQQRVSREITGDLARAVPMNRLLQGDVGSGKTVVAALAATVAMDAGWQCALMAPTEILAAQHFAKLVQWIEPILQPTGRCVAWLTGSQKKKERQAMLALIASGEAALVVGTHAVIQEHVEFQRLGLAIIDEQHRFGVAQRLALRSKLRDGGEPHLLMMTATPIPRTLAMAYLADLDVSTIDELPPGRTPIVTKLVADARRLDVIDRIRAQLIEGRQVYWVCPLIEESEALDLSNATATHAELHALLNPPGGAEVVVGLLHSRLSSADKQAVMAEFVQGRMGVLVSTTVIEVGVDVPNASLMVIEHAERFGLSQLHQLRGRVGRGAAASACVLLYSHNESGRLSETARQRLKAMAETADGFDIARRDLDIRGPGEFMGARQSGAAMLRFADLATDGHLLAWAQAAALTMLDQHPQAALRHTARWLGDKTDYFKA